MHNRVFSIECTFLRCPYWIEKWTGWTMIKSNFIILDVQGVPVHFAPLSLHIHVVPLFWKYTYCSSILSIYSWCPTILNIYVHDVPLFWTYLYMVSHYSEHKDTGCPTILNIFIHGIPLFWTYMNIVPLFWAFTHGVPLFSTYLFMVSNYSKHIYKWWPTILNIYIHDVPLFWTYIHGNPLFWTYIYNVSHYSEQIYTWCSTILNIHIYIHGVPLFWTYIYTGCYTILNIYRWCPTILNIYIYRVSNYPAPPWYKKCILLTDVVNFAWDTLQHVIVKAIIVRLVRLHKYKGPSRSLEYMYYNLILVCQEITRGQKNIKNILCKI